MSVNWRKEHTTKAWVLRAALGPAILLDGFVSTFTVGTLNLGVSLEVARRLSVERFNHLKRGEA